MRFSPYIYFSRKEWSQLRADTPLPLSEKDLIGLRGQNETIALSEVEDIFLPLSRLLNLYVAASQQLFQASGAFLSKPMAKVPYVIGLAGSVAVGKSTTSRILQTLLARWPDHPDVALIPTDGFLFPNQELERRGLMARKGFPESFDLPALISFLSDVKSGRSDLQVPFYSHHEYDIIPGKFHRLGEPDIVILEGLNVLQPAENTGSDSPRVFISDFFDFTIYVHAETPTIRNWYVKRFLTFSQIAREDPTSFFNRFAHMTDAQLTPYAEEIWTRINEVNLDENILPTRERAHLILQKGPDHSVEEVLLRKI